MKRLAVAAMVAVSLFGFNSINNVTTTNNAQTNTYYYNTPVVKGKVLKAYVQPGYGVRGYDWLFMDVKADNGKIYKVGIAPTFIISNLPVKEGDEVEVRGVTPPNWPDDSIRAWDINDLTQKKDYPITGTARGWGRGPGWRWR
jgi:hypothetical protein